MIPSRSRSWWRVTAWLIAGGLAVALPAVAADRAAADNVQAGIDAEKFFGAIVKVQAKALPDARSATTLGAERQGTGVVIDKDGLILTIGYLVVEADEVEISDDRGRTLPAMVVGYDQTSRLKRRLLAEVIEAVDRGDFEFAHVAVLQDAERDFAARGAASPHLAVELLL